MHPVVHRTLRISGWLLISSGTLVVLYLVYSLYFTNFETARAQDELSEQWAAVVDSDGDTAKQVKTVAPGEATAVLQFRKANTGKPVVSRKPLYVVQGTAPDDLQRGPGHYKGTALPGSRGNFAVAGHRTTYGAPFFDLGELEPGDEVFATGRDGVQHRYVVREQQIVSPDDTWVIENDPLGTGKPTLTLTTCHPRFSDRERMIVFAELA